MTSLVVGLGDEVLCTLIFLLLGGLSLLAWASSFVGERPRVEAVLIQPIGPQSETNQDSQDNVQRARVLWAQPRQRAVATQEPMTATNESESNPEVESAADESVVAAAGSPAAPAATQEREESKEEEEETQTSTSEREETSSTASPSSSSESVNIKVKFLNDTQREVKASLRDRLGRFKQNHLSDLLDGNQSVRLIFNGHVLRGEEQTLSQCGLFDNCVVHCLVTEQQQQQQNNAQQGPNRPVQADGGHFLAPDSDDLDLSHICYPMLGSILLIIWWCQLVYSHYFSLTSTVSLVSLTILFLASITNTYLTDV